MKKAVPEPVAAPSPPCRFLLRNCWRALFFLMVLGPASGLRADEVFSGPFVTQGLGIEISVTQLMDRTPGYGFVPVRILISNDSFKTRTWDFAFRAEINDDTDFALNHTQSVEVGSGKTKIVDILVPLPGIASGNRPASLQVTTSGYAIEYPIANLSNSWSNSPTVPVGMSQKLYTNFNGPLEAALKGVGYPYLDRGGPIGSRRLDTVGSSSVDRALVSTSLDFQKLPADWRSYSSLGKIFVSEEEWADISKAQEQAIWDWMALGGRLVVLGKDKPESSVSQGFGGRVDVSTDADNLPLPKLMAEVLKSDPDPVVPWKMDFTSSWGLNTEAGKLEVNTGLIICFVVAFGIVVAPLNLFFFAPSRHRHRLFWTVPLISVVGSLLLGAIIILQDGFGGSGARLAVVMLLPEEHKMAVVQEQVAKTALLLGQQFPLPDKVLLAALPLHYSGIPDGTAFRQEDVAGGDWFSSRTVKAYQLKTILPTRARVEIVGRSDKGAPIVLSSVPAELEQFFLFDLNGKIWKTDSLKTGEKQTLVPENSSPEWIKNLLADRASPNFQGLVDSVSNRPGFFYARAGSGGGIPIATLDSVRWKDDAVIYLGAWTEAKP